MKEQKIEANNLQKQWDCSRLTKFYLCTYICIFLKERSTSPLYLLTSTRQKGKIDFPLLDLMALPPLNLNSYIWRHFNRVGETTRNIPKQIKEKKYIIQSSLKIAYLFQWAVDQAKRLLIRSTFYKVDHYFKGKKKIFILCFCIMCHLTNIQKQ